MAMNWAYIAGFFDGEGSIRYAMGCMSGLQVQITQAGDVGLKTLNELAEFLRSEGMLCGVNVNRPSTPDRKTIYRLYIGSFYALKFLENMLPWLRIKRTQSQDVIRFRKLYPVRSKNVNRYASMARRA